MKSRLYGLSAAAAILTTFNKFQHETPKHKSDREQRVSQAVSRFLVCFIQGWGDIPRTTQTLWNNH
jgi:hypothetical protein